MEEKRNVNISFKTTASNKLEWIDIAKSKGMSLSEFAHCATELFKENVFNETKELKSVIVKLEQQLSKAKNEITNIKLNQLPRIKDLEQFIETLQEQNQQLVDEHKKTLDQVKELIREKLQTNKRIEEYANNFNAMQIGCFKHVNADEIRALKS